MDSFSVSLYVGCSIRSFSVPASAKQFDLSSLEQPGEIVARGATVMFGYWNILSAPRAPFGTTFFGPKTSVTRIALGTCSS
jgi:acyl-CoA synthetase (AMP-forming)/AMP-acid ligase II